MTRGIYGTIQTTPVSLQATPKIWNSDQGNHFTSSKYIQRLQSAGVQISMDGRSRARDNIFTERLWRTVKYEEVYLHECASPKDISKNNLNPPDKLVLRTNRDKYDDKEKKTKAS